MDRVNGAIRDHDKEKLMIPITVNVRSISKLIKCTVTETGHGKVPSK
jgi:hypothetical protein